MEQQLSNPVKWVGEEHLGFVINAAFSQTNTQTILSWLEGLQRDVPEGLYPMSADSLHVTVLDWVAPLFDYNGANKRELYNNLYPSYDDAFRHITKDIKAFDIHFTELRVTPGTIILVGQDGGEFQSLRDQLMGSVTLPDGGKQPPNIVHSSLARFIAPEIALSVVERYAESHPLDIVQRVTEFRLIETRREPMQDFSVLDVYKLAA